MVVLGVMRGGQRELNALESRRLPSGCGCGCGCDEEVEFCELFLCLCSTSFWVSSWGFFSDEVVIVYVCVYSYIERS